MDETERRRALAAFLRARRARLRPDDVGLPVRRRRRTPGLRREEVAELANIGVSWYTLLEQGQDIHPSREVFASLARALKLTLPEQQHLFLLARLEVIAPVAAEEALVTPALQRVVDALTPHPAFVIGRRWDVLTWNPTAELLFRFHQPCPPHSRNVVWRFFQDDASRTFDQDWTARAQSLVAAFRADYARYPDDESYRAVIEDLHRASPLFHLWWEDQDVRGLPDGTRSLRHPSLGLLDFEQATFLMPATPELHLKVYTASEETAAKLGQLLAASATCPPSCEPSR